MPMPAQQDTVQDDFGAAIAATIAADVLADGAMALVVGKSSSSARVSYGDRHAAYSDVERGRCLVRPLVEQLVEQHEGSTLTDLNFALEFDTLDANGNKLTFTKAQSAVINAVGDRGERVIANFVDSGENTLNVPMLSVQQIAEPSQFDGPDAPKLTVSIAVRVWLKLPRTSELEIAP